MHIYLTQLNSTQIILSDQYSVNARRTKMIVRPSMPSFLHNRSMSNELASYKVSDDRGNALKQRCKNVEKKLKKRLKT